jgi:cell division septation protein DedD
MGRVPARTAPQETLPAGTEEVIPAQLGGAAPGAAPQAAGGDSAVGGSSSPGDGSAPFRVHVASFRSVPKVEEMVSSLRARGLDAWHEPAANSPGWYRVFVGHYATREEAAQRAAWLLDHGWVDRAIAYPDTER